jgi:hypothetical protein
VIILTRYFSKASSGVEQRKSIDRERENDADKSWLDGRKKKCRQNCIIPF